MARKPMDDAERRGRVVQMRVTDADQALIKAAADREHRDVSDWLRLLAVREATRSAERAAKKAAKRGA